MQDLKKVGCSFPVFKKHYTRQDADPFEECLRQNTSKITKNSVMVLDNSNYHLIQIRNIPNNSWKKDDIENFLHENDLYFEGTYTNKQLLKVLRTKEFVKKFTGKIDELAKEMDLKQIELSQNSAAQQ